MIFDNVPKSLLPLSKIYGKAYTQNSALPEGLQEALRVLAGESNLQGGNIILVSDGEENQIPYVLDVLPEVSSMYFNYQQV